MITITSDQQRHQLILESIQNILQQRVKVKYFYLPFEVRMFFRILPQKLLYQVLKKYTIEEVKFTNKIRLIDVTTNTGIEIRPIDRCDLKYSAALKFDRWLRVTRVGYSHGIIPGIILQYFHIESEQIHYIGQQYSLTEYIPEVSNYSYRRIIRQIKIWLR